MWLTSSFWSGIFYSIIERRKHLRSGLRSLLWWTACVWSGGILPLLWTLYQPLPRKVLAYSRWDRTKMQVMETCMRIFFLWPSRRYARNLPYLGWWTDASLGFMAKILGPWIAFSRHLYIETTAIDGVRVRIYRPRSSSSAHSRLCVVFFHGGGFVMGDIETYESICRQLTLSMGAHVLVSVDYRRAPNTIFPGALEDCHRVVQFMIDNGECAYGIDTEKIIVIGDSAGANVAAAIAQRLTFNDEERRHRLLGQALIYPLTQLTNLRTPSYREHAQYDKTALPDPYSVVAFVLMYAGVDVASHPEYVEDALRNEHASGRARRTLTKLVAESSTVDDESNNNNEEESNEELSALQRHLEPLLLDPDFAPLMRENLEGLPPAIVLTCESDILRDEGAWYTRRLRRAKVPTRRLHYVHGFHAILNMHGQISLGRKMIEDIGKWTDDLIARNQSIQR